MSLKTPSFWYRPSSQRKSIRETLLWPLSAVYKFFYGFHQNSHEPYQSMIPVICIGNIVAGGTGKTPTAVALMELIRKADIAKNPHFMIRGYGGGEVGPLLVDSTKHNAWDVGDEALILAQHAPTLVGGDRAQSAKLGERSGADLILMDDGLQNPTLIKDLKLVVVNGEMGFGNGKMLPAGPLRQPLQEGLKNADGFIFIGEDRRDALSQLPKDKPVFHARLHPAQTDHLNKDLKYLAFAGLGYPEKFFSFLKQETDITLAGTVAFSDHHPYDAQDLRTLHEKAQNLGAALITTRKDAMRLPQIEGIEVHVMPVHMRFDDEDGLLDCIQKSIEKPST